MSRLVVVSNCSACVFCHLVDDSSVCVISKRLIQPESIPSVVTSQTPMPDWCPLPVEVQKS